MEPVDVDVLSQALPQAVSQAVPQALPQTSQASQTSQMVVSSDDELFAEESQSDTCAQGALDWREESTAESESSVGDLDVLEMVEVEGETPGEERNADETPFEAMLARREKKLQNRIDSKSGNPIAEAKSRMELASFYQENHLWKKAVQQYEEVQRALGHSRHAEEVMHYCVRCLSVCLRELHEPKAAERAVEALNKDIDVLVYRKTRGAAGEFATYYAKELQRDYEELGNCYMKYRHGSGLSVAATISRARRRGWSRPSAATRTAPPTQGRPMLSPPPAFW